MSKKKLYYFISVFFIVFLTIAGVNVRAHPPSDMTLEYNSNTNTLSVTITHGVSDNVTHYIASVQVKVNGSTDQTQFYSSQPDLNVFTYEYIIITNNGYTIQVTAICVLVGTITRTLEDTNAPTDGSEIPGYLGIYLIMGVSLIAFLTSIRRKTKKINF